MDAYQALDDTVGEWPEEMGTVADTMKEFDTDLAAL